MKQTAMICLLAAGAIGTSQAAIFEFDLGSGGLLGANERPTPNSSTASGGEMQGVFEGEPSIYYNNTTQQLFLNFGWGTDHGYTDLTGAFSGVHIHGSATSDAESTAGILYDLGSMVNLTSEGGQDGGVFQQFLQLVDNPNNSGYDIATQEALLFDGRWYVNVHSTPTFGAGEIRGQLVPVPEPQTYAMIAGLALAGFAGYRRCKAKAA